MISFFYRHKSTVRAQACWTRIIFPAVNPVLARIQHLLVYLFLRRFQRFKLRPLHRLTAVTPAVNPVLARIQHLLVYLFLRRFQRFKLRPLHRLTAVTPLRRITWEPPQVIPTRRLEVLICLPRIWWSPRPGSVKDFPTVQGHRRCFPNTRRRPSTRV